MINKAIISLLGLVILFGSINVEYASNEYITYEERYNAIENKQLYTTDNEGVTFEDNRETFTPNINIIKENNSVELASNTEQVTGKTKDDFVKFVSKQIIAYITNTNIKDTIDFTVEISNGILIRQTEDERASEIYGYSVWIYADGNCEPFGTIYVMIAGGEVGTIQYTGYSKYKTKTEDTLILFNKNELVDNSKVIDTTNKSQYHFDFIQPWCAIATSTTTINYNNGIDIETYITAKSILPVVYRRLFESQYDCNGQWDTKSEAFKEMLKIDPDMDVRFHNGINEYQLADTIKLSGNAAEIFNDTNFGYFSSLANSSKKNINILALYKVLGDDNTDSKHTILFHGGIEYSIAIGYDPVFKNRFDGQLILYINKLQNDNLRNLRVYIDNDKTWKLYEARYLIKTMNKTKMSENYYNTLKNIDMELANDFNNLGDIIEEQKEAYGEIESQNQTKIETKLDSEKHEETQNISIFDCKLANKYMIDIMGITKEQSEYLSLTAGTPGLKTDDVYASMVKRHPELGVYALAIKMSESKGNKSPDIKLDELVQLFDTNSIGEPSTASSQANFLNTLLNIRLHKSKAYNTRGRFIDIKDGIDKGNMVLLCLSNKFNTERYCLIAVKAEDVTKEFAAPGYKYRLEIYDPYDNSNFNPNIDNNSERVIYYNNSDNSDLVYRNPFTLTELNCTGMVITTMNITDNIYNLDYKSNGTLGYGSNDDE